MTLPLMLPSVRPPARYVEQSTATLEEVGPDDDDTASRITAAQDRDAWIVAEGAGASVGYAYGQLCMAIAAEGYSREASVRHHVAARGGGLGRALHAALLVRMESLGIRMACGGVAMRNDASVALHRAMGLEPVGTDQRIGWKHGQWRDVEWFEKPNRWRRATHMTVSSSEWSACQGLP